MRAIIKTSWWLTAVLVIGHAGAVLVGTRLSLPIAAQVLLAMCVTGSLVVSLRRHALRSAPGAITGIALRDDGSAAILRVAARDWQECELRAGYVHPLLVIVRIARGRFRSEAVVIPRDALDAETFRQLRVWLRWRRTPTDADQAMHHTGVSTVSAGGARSSGRG